MSPSESRIEGGRRQRSAGHRLTDAVGQVEVFVVQGSCRLPCFMADSGNAKIVHQEQPGEPALNFRIGKT